MTKKHKAQDYTLSNPLRVVTLTMVNGDKIPIVAKYDRFNDAWFVGHIDVQQAIRNINLTKGIACEEIVSIDVDRFYFGEVGLTSKGTILYHVSYRKIGDWEFKLKTKPRIGALVPWDGNSVIIEHKKKDVWVTEV